MPIDVQQMFGYADDLRKVPGRTATLTKRQVRKSTLALRRDVVLRAPKRTGKLRRDVVADTGTVDVGFDGLSGSVSIEDNDYYWFVECGTAFMDPQPFFDPASDEAESSFYNAMSSVAAESLKLR